MLSVNNGIVSANKTMLESYCNYLRLRVELRHQTQILKGFHEKMRRKNMDTEKFLEEQIKIELDKMTSNDNNSNNLNLVTKLIEGYVEYARTACLLQTVIELAQGDVWVSVIKDLLLESDVDDVVKQELLEHTISCQRLNSCDAIRELVRRVKNIDGKVINSIIYEK